MPLFAAGVALAYAILPKTIIVLVGFVPDGFENLVSGVAYNDFIVRMMLLFGVAAETPLVVCYLTAWRSSTVAPLVRARPWTIVIVFAAVATLSTDP